MCNMLPMTSVSQLYMLPGMTLGERIKYARKRLVPKMTQEALAKACGVSREAVSQWESGSSKSLTGENLVAAAKALQVRVEWLLNESGLMAEEDRAVYGAFAAPVVSWSSPEDLPGEEFVELPRIRVKVSAGNGKILFEEDRHAQGQAFRSDWIKRRQLRAEHLICVYAEGDSMEEVIHDGDSILIDTSQQVIQDGRVYALRYGDECRIKRLYKRPDGGLIIRSDNVSKYPEVHVPADQLEHIAIIGRVVWHGGDM